MARTYVLGSARKLVNAAMTMLVKAGVGPASTYLMTTTGRRTGQRRTTPVTLVEGDDGRWLVAPYGPVSWVHNLRARPVAELRRGRRRERLNAEEIDARSAGPVLRRYVREVTVTRPYFDARPEDEISVFVDEAGRHPVFRLTEPDDRP